MNRSQTDFILDKIFLDHWIQDFLAQTMFMNFWFLENEFFLKLKKA